MDDNMITVLTRGAMASTSSTDVQSRLWQRAPLMCDPRDQLKADTVDASSCTPGGANLADLAALIDPFVAQLSFGYNTGLVKQYLPRVNSIVRLETIPASEFPSHCNQTKGSFYVSYASTWDNGLYALEACMPYDQTRSPWKDTRDRQDLLEVLYLKVHTASTTAGYFELPSFESDVGGPLWPNGPPKDYYRHRHSYLQARSDGISSDSPSHVRRQATTNSTQLLYLEGTYNKGPLLTVAMALFGEGCFIADRVFLQRYYHGSNFEDKLHLRTRVHGQHCQEVAPFARLLVNKLRKHASSGSCRCC